MLDTMIKGGTVVTNGSQMTADVGLAGGLLAGLWLRRPDGTSDAPAAVETVDASGMLVMPGLIDCHLHTQTGSAYFSTRADDMGSVTRSAARAGITTVIPFVWGDPGEPIRSYLTTFIDLADRLSHCDFTAHCGLRPEMELIRQVPDAIELGITSFKMQYAYKRTGQGRMSDDDHRLAALQLIGRHGGLAMFHCENGLIIDQLENMFISNGQTSAEYFLKSRPDIAEAEAVHRTIELCELSECPVYVVHLTAERALNEIVAAQSKGLPVATETCPQYLTLTDEAVMKWGALAKIGPPLRTASDNDAMWRGLSLGQIESIGSDHSAQAKEHKLAPRDSFFEVPFGTAIVDVMPSVVFAEGVVKGRIPVETFVRAFTEAPARRFGLWPKKGSLHPGADADVVIWDPSEAWTVRADELPNPAGYSVYEGWSLVGRARDAWLRGNRVLDSGTIIASPGLGRQVER